MAPLAVKERVLVIFPGALGDLICLVPALRVIARRHPGCALELMARGELARFAVGRLGVSRGHSIDRREIAQLFVKDGAKTPRVREFFGFFRQIYSFFAHNNPYFREALDEVVDGRLTSLPFRPLTDGHVAEAYVHALGEVVDSTSDLSTSDLHFAPTPQDFAAARDRLKQNLKYPGEFILIFPGSGSPLKNWPPARFAELAANLGPARQPTVVLGPAEQELRPFFDNLGLTTLTGLELGELAAIARLSRGFVANDSGVAHLAAATGAPGVVLFGPTDPARWRPRGSITVLRHQPLAELPVVEVLTAINSVASDARILNDDD